MRVNGNPTSDLSNFVLYNGKLYPKGHPAVYSKKYRVVWPRVLLLTFTLSLNAYVLYKVFA